MSLELLNCYNRQGKILSAMPFFEIYGKPNLFYGVSNIWLVDKTGKFLASKISANCSVDQSCWQTFFGGKVSKGETHLLAAQREFFEELGVKIPINSLFKIDSGFSGSGRYYQSFVLLFDKMTHNFKPNPLEIVDLKWMTFSEYNREKNMFPEVWCGGCKNYNQLRIQKWLSGLKG